ncbi:MAG: hypothetical protein C6P37_15440 [Caldibacillus debilis]|uniref:Uncharacterized protein n=1 Tax=Caldibacillus debilis TaxID=301148 RepID=A0A3E0JX89_9BACI|nr:MAG: hypothetical protein C6W57_15860 [Caldibacillus debilis]REJ24871.1 MAG: hypothetical protein C6P37_15440 [Caldibacillus debilis]
MFVFSQFQQSSLLLSFFSAESRFSCGREREASPAVPSGKRAGLPGLSRKKRRPQASAFKNYPIFFPEKSRCPTSGMRKTRKEHAKAKAGAGPSSGPVRLYGLLYHNFPVSHTGPAERSLFGQN